MTGPARDLIVAVTQAEGPGSTLVSCLERAGVGVRLVPVVAHEEPADVSGLEAALADISQFDWVAFTSPRAVEAVCDRPAWRARSGGTTPRPRIAAVGTSTMACLTGREVPVAVCAAQPGAAGLARGIVDAEGGSLAGKRVLWPRSDRARPDLRDALIAAQATVVDPVAYRTAIIAPPDLGVFLEEVRARRIDAVTFMSPSSAIGLASGADDGTLAALAGRTVVASIGPTTSAALAGLHAPPDVEATETSASGLVSALMNYFAIHHGVTV